jgi:hypothetical protein
LKRKKNYFFDEWGIKTDKKLIKIYLHHNEELKEENEINIYKGKSFENGILI